MTTTQPNGKPAAPNPVLAHVVRGNRVESSHRGSWVVVDSEGTVVAGAGSFRAPVFARSSMKSMQALPLLESGAAERFSIDQRELALALASHNAAACHTEPVLGLLGRLGLGAEDLGCGAQEPRDREAREALARAAAEPSGLHNNCSGKHAGFLALARHLEEPPARYLDFDSRTQGLVREAVCELTDTPATELYTAIDGCSAPTFELPLDKLARGIARIATPQAMGAKREEACRRITDAAARFPELIAGKKRICTDIARVSEGKLFPKVGAEAVYVLGLVGRDLGLAIKIDDGGFRALHAVVCDLLERLEWLEPDALQELEPWRGRSMRNWAGLEVGHIEVVCAESDL